MFCSHCGKEIANDAKFCSFCGGAVNSPATTQGSAKENVALPPLPQANLYNIKLWKGSAKAVKIIKKLRPELSIFDIAQVINTPQKVILSNVSHEQATAIKKELETAGAKVTLVPVGAHDYSEHLHASPVHQHKKNGCSKIGCGALAIIFFTIVALATSDKESSEKTNTPTTTDSHTQSTASGKKTDAQTQTSAPEKKTETKAPHKAPIEDGAIYTYPETEKGLKDAGFPKMLKKLGLSNIKKANQLMPKAAEIVAMNPKCDAVVHVDISDRSERNKLIIYADAKNGQRFYLTENEILSSEPAISEQEQLAPLLWRHELMAEEVIKSKLTHPSTYDRHEMGIWQSETTANCNQIMIEFSAKNSFGVELTYIAVVQFDKNSNVVGFHMQEKR